MTETPAMRRVRDAEQRMLAGRCIPLLRWHRWTRWQEIDGLAQLGSGRVVDVIRQERRCVRCGRIQIDKVTR